MEGFGSSIVGRRDRDRIMSCSSTGPQNSGNFVKPPSVTSTTGTVLPPSFHPLTSRAPRDGLRGADSLHQEFHHPHHQRVAGGNVGSQNLQRVRAFAAPSSLSSSASATATSRRHPVPVSGHCAIPIPGMPGETLMDANRAAAAATAAITARNPAMIHQQIPAWNSLGFFPVMSMDHLVPSQIAAAGFAPWAGTKQPVINRDYLELAMLVCNTFRGKLFPCPHCRYVTDRRNNLKRHVATMHETCEKTLECCGVVFQTKASLREHIMIFHHNGYSCPYCGRRFCRKALLKRHLSVHSGRKDYTCPHCDYATSHKSNLERHKKIHERSIKRSPLDNESNSMFLKDNKTPFSDPIDARDPSPAPQDCTVTCSAMDLSSSAEKITPNDVITSLSDSSTSEEDVDVECG